MGHSQAQHPPKATFKFIYPSMECELRGKAPQPTTQSGQRPKFHLWACAQRAQVLQETLGLTNDDYIHPYTDMLTHLCRSSDLIRTAQSSSLASHAYRHNFVTFLLKNKKDFLDVIIFSNYYFQGSQHNSSVTKVLIAFNKSSINFFLNFKMEL